MRTIFFDFLYSLLGLDEFRRLTPVGDLPFESSLAYDWTGSRLAMPTQDGSELTVGAGTP
jgi:hypothetical protein